MLHIFHLDNSNKTMWRFGHRWENNIKAYHKTKNHIKAMAWLTELRIRPVMNIHKCSMVFKNFTITWVSTHQGRRSIIESLMSFYYVSQLVSKWVSEWRGKSVHQPVSISVSQSALLSVSQSLRAPVTQMPVYYTIVFHFQSASSNLTRAV